MIRAPQHRKGRRGFTLLELMMAMFVFSLVLTAVYSAWLSILKGSKVGIETAADVQRSRISIRALEDAFVTAVMFRANIKHYHFFADTSGDMAVVSMVSRLPASFPGVGRYGDAVVRRVSFYTKPGPDGNELWMAQAPMLQDTNEVEAYSLQLAKDVTLFQLEFYDLQKNEWVEEWRDTNAMPRMVKILLGMGKSKSSSSDPRDVVTRIVAMPTFAAAGDLQGAGAPLGVPGAMPTPGMDGNPIPPVGGLPPGINPGGAYPGGAYPGGAYPGGAYPGGAYPGGAYPGGAYPGGAYPGGAYPGGAYPGGAYPGGAYPGGAYPGGGFNNPRFPGGQRPPIRPR